jgi:hypothetical protein
VLAGARADERAAAGKNVELFASAKRFSKKLRHSQ